MTRELSWHGSLLQGGQADTWLRRALRRNSKEVQGTRNSILKFLPASRRSDSESQEDPTEKLMVAFRDSPGRVRTPGRKRTSLH